MLSCKQSGVVSCAEDAHFRSYARRYGPASDAQFLRSIADKTPGRDDVDGARQMRHVYLKSYVLVTEDDDAKEANHAIMNKTRRAVVGVVSKYLVLPSLSLLHWRPRRSRPRKHSGGSTGKYLLSLLLSRLLACTGTGTGTGRHKQPPSSSSSSCDGDAAVAN